MRVPSLSPEDVDEEYRDLMYAGFDPDRQLNLYSALGNNPEVLAGFRTYVEALWNESGLSARERELVILAVADEADSDYERYQHVRIAEDVGLSQAEMDAVAAGDHAPFTEAEAALVEYARAVTQQGVTDDLHDRLAAEYDASTVVGIANLAAAYYGLAHVIDALEIEPGGE